MHCADLDSSALLLSRRRLLRDPQLVVEVSHAVKVGQDRPEEARRQRAVVEGDRPDEPEAQFAVQLRRLVVGRHRHETHRVAFSQCREQLANQRRGDSPTPDIVRESGG